MMDGFSIAFIGLSAAIYYGMLSAIGWQVIRMWRYG